MKTAISSIKLTFLFFSLILSEFIYSEIEVDGKVIEEEWSSAIVVEDFFEIFPFTLNDPAYKTRLLILEKEDGLYFGFINSQPKETLRSQLHQRDDRDPKADRVGVSIDFDGDSLQAYDFTVSLGGSLWDSVYTNSDQGDSDWDADWQAATSEGENGWYAELFIPWSVTPMKKQIGEVRKVRLAAWRQAYEISRAFSTARSNPYRSQFLSYFKEYEFKKVDAGRIDFFPYLTTSNERTTNSTNFNGGAEIFWKIDSNSQFNITFDPDFGQVESDDVVINFSATETFYQDKRPFFSENQSLFRIDGYRFFHVINTRRIGASPDYNCSQYESQIEEICNSSKEDYSDIDAAFRYTSLGQNYDVGFLGAFESNSPFSSGRDFAAARVRTSFNNLTYGYLGTYTQNSVLDRNANVNAFDFDYRPSKMTSLYAVLLNSNVNGQSGYGGRIMFSHMFNPQLMTGLGLLYMGENIDMNDMGYQSRNNRISFGGRTSYEQTNFSEEDLTLKRNYRVSYMWKTSNRGDREPAGLEFKFENDFKNNSSVEFEMDYSTKGKDVTITRESPLALYVNRPEGKGVSFKYSSPRNSKFTYTLYGRRGNGSEYGGNRGWTSKYYLGLGYQPSSNLSYYVGFSDEKENNWLNWTKDNLLATYDREQRNLNATIKWFKGNKHELRVRAQLVSFTARNGIPYIADSSGDLFLSNYEVNSFTLGNLAFQIRYKYEILPLSYLYLVYTKGGSVFELDEEDSFEEIVKRPWLEPDRDNFTIKVRYRF